MKTLITLAGLTLLTVLPLRLSGPPSGAAGTEDPAPAAPAAAEPAHERQESLDLEAVLAASGMRADLEAGVLAVPVRVLVKNDLLEYLLVGPRGAGHESLFQTEVTPSLINAVALAAGFTEGKNAALRPAEDGGTFVRDPLGAPTYFYAAWREGEETYLYRVEDLLTNLDTGRSMKRHGWVFLGSRFGSLREGEDEVFLADVEENLVNVTYFYQGNTLWTAALPACVDQTIWAANGWLLPPRETPVWLVVSRKRLGALPAGWAEALPRVTREVRDDSER